MSVYATPGQVVKTSTKAAPGLVGTLAFRFIDLADDATAETPRLTTGIVESDDSPGLYIATAASPTVSGVFAREWWDGQQAWYDDEDLEVGTTPREGAHA